MLFHTEQIRVIQDTDSSSASEHGSTAMHNETVTEQAVA